MHRVLIKNNNRGSRKVSECGPSVGFIKSISTSDPPKPSINLNMVLDLAQFKGLIGGLNRRRGEGKQDEAQIRRYQSPSQLSIEEIVDPMGSKRRLNQDEAEMQQRRVLNRDQELLSRYSGEDQMSCELQRKRRSGKNKVWSRAATVALSSSVSQTNNHNRRRKERDHQYLLNEAQATIHIGKALGVDFEGKEREVTEKIITMERNNRSQAPKRIVERNVDMVLFQETKRSEMIELFVKSLWPEELVGFMVVDAEGSAGGLVCVWRPKGYEEEFMEILGNLKPKFPKPWCIGGDFNEVRAVAERKGCIMRDGGMNEFNDFLNTLELVDVPMIGRKHTWCNSQEGERWSRLDRFLVSPEWLAWFSFKLWGLSRSLSDHCPILLMEDERDWGPKPFRFLNAWVLYPTFLDKVKSVWEDTQVDRWAGLRLKVKLKALKEALKVWNIEVFRNVEYKLKEVENAIHVLDLAADERPLNDIEISKRREVKGEIRKLRKMKEWIWVQKSRVNWALKGDRNTRYFHIIATKRLSRNLMDLIIINGTSYNNPQEMKREISRYFGEAFAEAWRKYGLLLRSVMGIKPLDLIDLT
ncbi:hypothetical protein ACSBR2_027885 [Camellia fascicularis]